MADPPIIYTGAHVKVDIQDMSDPMDTLLFKSVQPPDWRIDAPRDVFHGDQNQPYPVIASVQHPQYGQMTLVQGWDKNHVMATWRALMESQKPLSEKWKSVTVTWYDSDGTTAFNGWHTDHAILVDYKHAGSDASSNAQLTVNITLEAVEAWQQTDGNAQIQA